MKKWQAPQLESLDVSYTFGGGNKAQHDGGDWQTLPNGDQVLPGTPSNS